MSYMSGDIEKPPMNDTQNEPREDIGIQAGIQNLQVTFKSPRWTLLLDLELLLPLGEKRGVHMSRLVVPHYVEYYDIEGFIEDLKQQIFAKTKDYPQIKIKFLFPWRDQFAEIEIFNNISIQNHYTFSLKGITACPCSKETCGVGHMQKCLLTVGMRQNKHDVSFEWVLGMLERCFSATLNEKLKRDEEAQKIQEAQKNSLFVEDVVRKAVKTIPDITFARAESDESIHSHKAVAKWQKK